MLNTTPSRILFTPSYPLELSSRGLEALSILLSENKDDSDVMEFFKRAVKKEYPFIVPSISVINRKTKIIICSVLYLFYNDKFGFSYPTSSVSFKASAEGKIQAQQHLALEYSFFDLIGNFTYNVFEFHGNEFLKKENFNKKLIELTEIAKKTNDKSSIN